MTSPLTGRESLPAAANLDELLSSMRAFAEQLTEDLGPMFGRDVCRLIDVLESSVVVFADPRLGYVDLQVDREAWLALNG